VVKWPPPHPRPSLVRDPQLFPPPLFRPFLRVVVKFMFFSRSPRLLTNPSGVMLIVESSFPSLLSSQNVLCFSCEVLRTFPPAFFVSRCNKKLLLFSPHLLRIYLADRILLFLIRAVSVVNFSSFALSPRVETLSCTSRSFKFRGVRVIPPMRPLSLSTERELRRDTCLGLSRPRPSFFTVLLVSVLPFFSSDTPFVRRACPTVELQFSYIDFAYFSVERAVVTELDGICVESFLGLGVKVFFFLFPHAPPVIISI